MNKRNSGNTVRVETWVKERGTKNEKQIVKVAVRNRLGQFHGATNFPVKN